MSENLPQNLEQYQDWSPEHREADARDERSEAPRWEIITHPSERMMIVNDVAHTLQKIQAGQYDTLVWLDKSARPLDTVLRSAAHELWGRDNFQTRFLAVGSLSKIREHERGDLPEEIVKEVRERYHPDPQEQSWGKVLVLDELKSSGGSVRSAARLFDEAFRDHEKYGIESVDYDDVLSQYPIWYNSPELIGVEEDVDVVKSEINERLEAEGKSWIGELGDQEHKKFTEKLDTAGKKVTAERYEGKDQKVREFRQELSQLGKMTAIYYRHLEQLGPVSDFVEPRHENRQNQARELFKGTPLLEVFPELVSELEVPPDFAVWEPRAGGYFALSDESLEKLLDDLETRTAEENLVTLGKITDFGGERYY